MPLGRILLAWAARRRWLLDGRLRVRVRQAYVRGEFQAPKAVRAARWSWVPGTVAVLGEVYEASRGAASRG
jgi:hypothetical protein